MYWVLFQLVLGVGAGVALWFLWRRFVAPLRIGIIVTLGFLVRAVAAQILFWISYLQLPVARSLQRGNGIWFFGIDAHFYFPPAAHAANTGLRQVMTINPTEPSVVYIKTLSLFAWLFGVIPSVALLLNLFAYLGTAILIIAWGRRANVDERVVAIPLVVISFTPTWILWSLQPLKDTFFIFLVVLFAFALYSWVVDMAEGVFRRALADALVFFLAIYLIAGIRWYFSVIILVSAFLPMFAAALRPPGTVPRIARVAATILVLALSTQSIVVGAGPYLPEVFRSLLRPGTNKVGEPNEIAAVVKVLEEARDSFKYYKDAGTSIGGGKLILTEKELTKARSTQRRPAKAIPQHAQGGHPVGGEVAQPATASPDSGVRDIILPGSRAGRLFAGLSAIYLPRFIATHLGLISIGGGKGFWWFAELDTVVFMVLVVATVSFAVRRRKSGGWRNPITWYIVTAAILCTGTLAYAISNFGTLLRHREMIAIFLALLPLVWLSRRPGEHSIPPA